MNKMQRLLRAAAVAAAAAAVAPAAPLGAQIAEGSRLSFTGTADATDVGTSGVLLDFDTRVVADASGNTGSFAALNRPGGPGVSGAIADVRVGNGPQAVPNLLVLGGYRFDLTFVPSGASPQEACYVEPVVGQQCTPYQSEIGVWPPSGSLSPFYLVNAPSGDPGAPFTAVAAFDVVGTVTGPGGASSPFSGTLASTFVGRSYQEVLYTLEQQGLAQVTFAGTFVAGAPTAPGTVAPEPSAVALVAAGLAGVAGAARRRRRA
jgi:hypothetical protein